MVTKVIQMARVVAFAKSRWREMSVYSRSLVGSGSFLKEYLVPYACMNVERIKSTKPEGLQDKLSASAPYHSENAVLNSTRRDCTHKPKEAQHLYSDSY